MGYGDDLMGTGMARGLAARGKRAAFGDGLRIIWGPWSEAVFQGNPNVARPGSEGADDLVWIPHYKGRRMYNRFAGNHWRWNLDFHAVPGEVFFNDEERRFARTMPAGAVLIEPNVPRSKSVARNKDWGADRYHEVARRLRLDGHKVVQLWYRGATVRVEADTYIETPSFRHGLAALSRAALYIGPEGGMHHGAAAVGIPAVVMFGGFIPPSVTGYATHTNLTGGILTACGNTYDCSHCQAAMRNISVEEVHQAAQHYLVREAA